MQWEARSLSAFGDQPLEDIAGDYDLLVIDHPFCGRAAQTACLTPLDELLDEETLAGLAAGAVGPSHDSYAHAGHQWALATDAACQVAAVREDLLPEDPTPRSWDEALDLATRRPGAVALPLSPPHAISSWLSIAGLMPSTRASRACETPSRAVSTRTRSPSGAPYSSHCRARFARTASAMARW